MRAKRFLEGLVLLPDGPLPLVSFAEPFFVISFFDVVVPLVGHGLAPLESLVAIDAGAPGSDGLSGVAMASKPPKRVPQRLPDSVDHSLRGHADQI